MFASPQSLSNHRKRNHSGNGVLTVSSGLPPKLRSRAQSEKRVKKILDIILKPKMSGNVQNLQDTSLSLPNGKISKVSTDENLSTDNESDSGAMDTENSDNELVMVPKDKKDSEIIDLFQKLYSHFDEDDVELCNNILNLLTVLKEKGCVTEQEYRAIKSRLEKMKQLNLYESIDSTVENMTRDDKNEILGLLRSMKNDELVAELLGLVKNYFENETSILPRFITSEELILKKSSRIICCL